MRGNSLSRSRRRHSSRAVIHHVEEHAILTFVLVNLENAHIAGGQMSPLNGRR